jgi:hypothetical protein
MLLCLLDWVMEIPQSSMLATIQDHDDSSSSGSLSNVGTTITYLQLVMKTFKKTAGTTNSELRHNKLSTSVNINQLLLGDSRPIRLARVHNDLSMDDVQGITDEDDNTTTFLQGGSEDTSKCLELTSRYCLSQVLNFYEHFPFDTGAA